MDRKMMLINSYPFLYHLYDRFYVQNVSRKVGEWPFMMNVELTTRCNSKCVFCQHERYIADGVRPLLDMSDDVQSKVQSWIKSYSVDHIIDNVVPVGLGEPLLAKGFDRFVKFVYDDLPSSSLDLATNGQLLHRKYDVLLKYVDSVTVSLCFNDPFDYYQYMGVDCYEDVLFNLKEFLKMDRKDGPSVRVHIFDTPQNHPRFKAFINDFKPLLTDKDDVYILRLLDNSIVYDTYRHKFGKLPCNCPWKMLSFGVQGDVFPCCNAGWRNVNSPLRIGHVDQSVFDIMIALREFRESMYNGDVSRCEGCCTLAKDKLKDVEHFSHFNPVVDREYRRKRT